MNIEAFHKDMIIWDAHRDVAYEAPIEERFLQRWTVGVDMHLPIVRRGGIDVQVYAIAVATTLDLPPTVQALKELEIVLTILESNNHETMLATNISEVQRAMKEGKLAVILSMEGGEPILSELGLIRMFYRLGFRSIGLTWNFRNAIADGGYEGEEGGGLSKFGRDVVKEMNRLGMLIDVAHMTDKGILDVLKVSDAPVILSHGTTRALRPGHHRAYKNAILEAIANNKGVFCVTTIPEALSVDPNQATLSHFIDHVEQAISVMGEDYVGLGSDFDVYRSHLGLPPERWLKNLEEADKLPNVTASLLERGYSERVIRKIMGENLFRLYNEVIG